MKKDKNINISALKTTSPIRFVEVKKYDAKTNSATVFITEGTGKQVIADRDCGDVPCRRFKDLSLL